MKAFKREAVKSAIKDSVLRVYAAEHSNLDLYRNTLDCFSSSIDSVIQGISLDEWMIKERERQIQKTKQNAIGTLHEKVMGAIPGVANLPVGNLIDVISIDKRLVAEVKNKHNTTKGNHKVAIYHDLAQALDTRKGYIGYYVEILPKGQEQYNKPFTPSDNKTKKKLPERADIRVIDGKSFYELLTGVEGALSELYLELPILVAEIINEKYKATLKANLVTESDAFTYNFSKVYGE